MPEDKILAACRYLGIRWQDLDVTLPEGVAGEPEDPLLPELRRAAAGLGDAPGWVVKKALQDLAFLGKVARLAPPDRVEKAPPPEEPPAVRDNVVPYSRANDPRYQGVVDNNVDDFREVEEVWVPVWDGLAASAPDGVEPEYLGFWPVVHSKKKDSWRVLRIRGTSMEPTLHDGDMVLVDIRKKAREGDLVVVWIEGEGLTIKEFGGVNYHDGTITLIPHNRREHKVLVRPADQVQVRAVYLEITRSLRYQNSSSDEFDEVE